MLIRIIRRRSVDWAARHRARRCDAHALPPRLYVAAADRDGAAPAPAMQRKTVGLAFVVAVRIGRDLVLLRLTAGDEGRQAADIAVRRRRCARLLRPVIVLRLVLPMLLRARCCC